MPKLVTFEATNKATIRQLRPTLISSFAKPQFGSCKGVGVPEPKRANRDHVLNTDCHCHTANDPNESMNSIVNVIAIGSRLSKN